MSPPPAFVVRGCRRAFLAAGNREVTAAELFAWCYARRWSCPMDHRGDMVMWGEADRRELAELCRVDDQMMAEQRANDPGEELVFKVMEDARPPVLEPEPEPFTEYQSDVLVQVIVELRKERDEAIAPLKAEIADLKGKLDAVAELKGKVDALLTLLQGAKAEVIGLPRKRPSDAA